MPPQIDTGVDHHNTQKYSQTQHGRFERKHSQFQAQIALFTCLKLHVSSYDSLCCLDAVASGGRSACTATCASRWHVRAHILTLTTGTPQLKALHSLKKSWPPEGSLTPLAAVWQ